MSNTYAPFSAYDKCQQALGDVKRLSLSIRQLQIEHCDVIAQMGFDLSELIHIPRGVKGCYPVCSLNSIKHSLIVSIKHFFQTSLLLYKITLSTYSLFHNEILSVAAQRDTFI